MAAIARFGFEGGKVPSNVNISMDNTTSSSLLPIGRNGGTCVQAMSIPTSVITSGSLTIPMTYNSSVSASFMGTYSVYLSCQMKLISNNQSTVFRMFQLGNVFVDYDISVQKLYFRRGKSFATFPDNTFYMHTSSFDTLYTSPATVVFASNNVWVPVTCRLTVSSTVGEMTVNVDGTNYSLTSANTQLNWTGSLPPTQLTINLGCVSGSNISTNTWGTFGPPTFQLDDVAINNINSGVNTSGSFGMNDSSTPAFISCKLVNFISTGSNVVGWSVPDGKIINSITASDGIYLTSSFYPRPVLTLIPSSSMAGAATVEGINYYINNAYREGSSNVYLSPYIISSTGTSSQAQSSLQLNSYIQSASFSVFEKDLGGKITYTEFLNSNIVISSSQWINKNYFGLGSLGDVRYTASVVVGDGTANSVVLEYNNLILDAGATMSPSVKKNGLFIYVRENCIINGSISMTGLGNSFNSPGSLVFYKNISSFDEISSSIFPSTYLPNEQLYQPTTASTAAITIPLTAGTGTGGGGGGSWNGSVSTTFSGGWNGAANAAPGGMVFLIVGKNLIINTGGSIVVRGTDSNNNPGGTPGTGGGGINIFYGKNFINSGSFDVSGAPGTYVGNPGSVRIQKILSN